MPLSASPRLATLRAVLDDHRRRGLHAARHSRGRGSAGPRVFNLDLHVAVIADVRTMLAERGIGVTDWSISNHAWVFDRNREPVAVVNERTAPKLDSAMIRRFQRVYGAYLRSFDGYVATHTPCFSLLYRGLPGPTLAVCSTRYEWPFTFDREGWRWLNEGLERGLEEGWLHLVANNLADVDYVANYLGITPAYVPSACSYVSSSYTGRREAVLVAAKSDRLAAAVCDRLTCKALPLRRALGKRYAWADLYDYRAIVFIPYNVSVMALFEHYSACAPIYVPSRALLKELMAEHPDAVLSQLSYAQASTEPAAPPDGSRDLNDLRDEEVVDWYLDRADFYDERWMPRIRQFDSLAHLDQLLSTDDPAEISAQMEAELPARLTAIRELWDELQWLARVGEGAPRAAKDPVESATPS